MLERRVVVTGVGVVSPFGDDVEEFWRSIVEGKSGVGKITHFPVDDFPTKIAAQVNNFEPERYIEKRDLRKMDRFVQFSLVAAIKAVEDAGLDFSKEDPALIGAYIGSGIGGLNAIETQHRILIERGPKRVTPFLIPMLIIDIASGWISIYFGIKGPNSAVVTACASGTHAIGDSFKIIQRGDSEVMITGGAEAAITPLAMAGFCSARALSTRNDAPEKASRPFDRKRDGFVIGEGAGVVVLESLEHARSRGAKIYAELLGYGMTGDAYHITAPAPKGVGAAKAIEVALRDAKIKPQEVNYINAHGTSTPLNDKCETQAIKSVFGKHAYRIPISSTKSMIGHLLGAAGGVEFVATVLTLVKGVIPPTINYEYPDEECDLDYVPNKAREVGNLEIAVKNSLGFGGHNAILVIKRWREGDGEGEKGETS